MPFRSEEEALRAKIGKLEAELADAQRKLAASEASLARVHHLQFSGVESCFNCGGAVKRGKLNSGYVIWEEAEGKVILMDPRPPILKHLARSLDGMENESDPDRGEASGVRCPQCRKLFVDY